VIPSLSLLSKANDIWTDMFRVDVQRVSGLGRRRHRSSIMHTVALTSVMKKQLKHFPRWQRLIFTAFNMMMILFFVVWVLIQLATQPTNATCNRLYTEEIWKACAIPVPFCKHPFVAKCDCSALLIQNYSQPQLPSSFGNMSSLILLYVDGGRLEQLPDNFGTNHRYVASLRVQKNQLIKLPEFSNLKNLITLWVPNNKLTVLPNSVGELSNLITLAVQYNNLTALPQSIGKLLFMSWLYVDYNRLTSLPDSVGNLPYLYEIYGNNNKLTSLPESIGTLKHLIRLDVSNNRLSALPMGLKNLQTLYAWNNTLQQLPDGMVSLSQIDVRYNQLKTLPIGGWGNVEYLSVHGNPLCPSYTFPVGVKGGFCETQCSIDCPSVRLGDGFCDDIDYTYAWYTKKLHVSAEPLFNSGCNTKACAFDQGDCLRRDV
jgi:hypothetical protein